MLKMVSLPKRMFTVVIQKGWKQNRQTGMGNNNKREKEKKKKVPSFLLRLLALGGCYCCHGYKITNTYEVLHSSHRRCLKK